MSAVVRIDLSGLARRMSAEVGAFTAWWLQELRATWIALVEKTSAGSAQRFVLDLSGEPGALRKADGAVVDLVAPLAVSQIGELTALRDSWPQAPASGRVVVLLPEAATLVCELRLPPIPERDVAAAVRLQLERRLPLPAEQLCLSWHVQQKYPDGSRAVIAAMARRRYVETLRDAIRSWRWRAVAIRPKSQSQMLNFNLLPAPASRWSFAMERREVRMAWSAFALCVVYMLAVGGQWWYERASLADTLQHARKQLGEMSRRERELSDGAAPLAAIRELMRAPTASEALAAVSLALPTDSWMYRLDIQAFAAGPTLRAEGYTQAPASAVAALERSPQLQAVELIETSAAEMGGTGNRIALKARLVGGDGP